VAVISQTSTSLWRTELSGGGPVANSSLSGNEEGAAAKIHQTVRWCTGLSGEPKAPVANDHLRDQQRHVANPTIGWSQRIVRCAPDSVRCANGPGGPTVGCTRYGRKSSTGHVLFMSGDAPDCPVHHSTEDKICLLS
jgi:hypothetical protein